MRRPGEPCHPSSDGAAALLFRIGVDRLRTADASTMPIVTGGDTDAPAMTIGEKAADLASGRAPETRRRKRRGTPEGNGEETT